MQLDAAIKAQPIAAELTQVNATIATVQAAIDGPWRITNFSVADPGGNQSNLLVIPVDDATKNAALKLVLAALQGYAENLTTQLAAL